MGAKLVNLDFDIARRNADIRRIFDDFANDRERIEALEEKARRERIKNARHHRRTVRGFHQAGFLHIEPTDRWLPRQIVQGLWDARKEARALRNASQEPAAKSARAGRL